MPASSAVLWEGLRAVCSCRCCTFKYDLSGCLSLGTGMVCSGFPPEKTVVTIFSSNYLYMLIFFIIFIAPSYPIYASVCMLWVSSICVVSLSPCLAKMLALHSEPVFVKMIFVQVCSESVGHAECSELVNMLSSRYGSTSPIKAGNDAGTR